MKILLQSLILLITFNIFSQNIAVDAQTYTPQQLVEDVLINSGCIQNILITNTVGGDFGNGDKSFGYFSGNGSNFPFESGIVMATGQLSHIPGPNNYLSDDDAPNWTGDADLENALNISNTTNATIIEFDFVPNADNIRFRYIFASEEYQEGSPNTCIYSDAFAFLIKPIGGDYNNIALVPGTNTPVQVTTVHSGIPGACPPINETYFEGWNGVDVPINFNGQTKILAAETSVMPNTQYHIKLVIADEQNYRYDSAVFLEAESFNISANLGPDRSFVTNNPLCDGEIYVLDATPAGNPLGYTWFKNGVVILGENSPQLTVTAAGLYKVEIDYATGCTATDEVVIDYASPVAVEDTELFQCEPEANGIAIFNLYDATSAITNNDISLRVEGFYSNFNDAENDQNVIQNPSAYTNSTLNEIIYARVLSIYDCVGIASVILKTTINTLPPYDLGSCSLAENPRIAQFDLTQVSTEIEAYLNGTFEINYFLTYDEAIANENALPDIFTNTENGFQIIYARISAEIGCVGIAEINLTVVPTPQFRENNSYVYCNNIFPNTITIDSGVLGSLENLSFLWSTGETTPTIEVNAAGNYEVTVGYTEILNGQMYVCMATNAIVVTASENPQFTYQITGTYGDQNIVVTAIGIGDYEYALDNEADFFQDSPVFEHVLGGMHIIYVRDKNGCGTVAQVVYVLDFPRFFTPNGDGIHDFWKVAGLNSEMIQVNKVEIFDRFNKYLYTIIADDKGWDGNYRGIPLPSSDYWFVVYFNDSRTYRDHFSLKR